MKITIEKIRINDNDNRSGSEIKGNSETKIVLGLEKLPSMDNTEWIVLKEALDHLASILMKIDT